MLLLHTVVLLTDIMMPKTSDPTTPEPESAGEALHDGLRSLREAISYFRLMLSTKLDRWKLSVLMVLLYAALGVFGAAAGVAVVVTAVVLLLLGAAHGLGVALGDRAWLGDIIVGFVLLAGLTIGVTSVLDRFVSASRKRTIKKYEARHSRQRQTFGRDVAEQAGAAHAA